MIFSRASFEKLSIPMQSLILTALPVPLFAVFAIAGDLPRGALAWTFSGTLLIALNAQKDGVSFRKLGPPAAVLLMLHLPVVVSDPLRHAHVIGGIIKPIALVDGCIDYAFVWLWLRMFKNG